MAIGPSKRDERGVIIGADSDATTTPKTGMKSKLSIKIVRKGKHDPLLAANWPGSAVSRCLRQNRKEDLIKFLRERYNERFFQPIRHLRDAEGNEQGYGFAMMALCSLLIESIQCCRDGLPSTHRQELGKLAQYKPSKNYQVPNAEWKNGYTVFCDFFTDFSDFFPDVDGGEFYSNIRNGLLHQAQTKGRWTIRMCQARLFDPDKKIIDRNSFAHGLEDAFGKYLDELAENEWESTVWKRARRKIWWLIRLSR